MRILSLNSSLENAQALATKQSAETRIWPMSCAANILWRSVSNIDLLGLVDIDAILVKEYNTFKGRIDSWNTYRSEKSVEVFESARLKERRPYHQLFAENLLQRVKNGGSSDLASKVKDVPECPRDNEIRGQEWALIAIIGDTEYEKARENLLNDLGYKYIDFIASQNRAEPLNAEDVSKVEVQDSILNSPDPAIEEDAFVNTVARQAKLNIDALVKEPMIAFFGVSDEPQQLLKMSSELSKQADLLHADIAVVRMYSWLVLNSSSKASEHTSRDPRADTFFKAMRQTLEN